MASGYGSKQEEEQASETESSRIPLLWSSLIDTGLAEVQQNLGGVISKRWLHVDSLGMPKLVEVDKHRVVSELGIRYRDLLILDPTIPTPSPCTLLIRDRALVANLEAVRMIIAANQVYVLSVPKASDPRVATFPTLDSPFVRQLCKCLREHKSTATLHDLSRQSAAFDYDAPFELRALEVGLATVANTLDREVYELEKAAFPAIDKMARNVSRSVLEEVRQVKQVMGRLIARVQRLRSELEEILDDDMDMADMYLGRRAALMGEELPHNPLGLVGTPAQSTKSMGDLARRTPLPPQHHSEGELSRADGAASSQAAYRDLPHPPSTSSLASSLHDGTAAPGPGLYPAAEANWRPPLGGRGDAPSSTSDLHRPAAEHLGHHRPGSHGDGQNGGRQHAGSSAQGGAPRQHWQRSSTVVRTVRTLRKRKGQGRAGSAASPTTMAAQAAAEVAAAGEGAGGDGLPPAVGDLGKSDSAPPAISTELAGDGDDTDSDDGDVIETIIEQPGGAAVDPHDIQDAEDLLESYFIQVDYVLRRLLTVSERIDDVEDLVSIEMDHRRNELVATDLAVSILSCGFGFCAAVVGVFGVNLMPFSQSHGFFWGMIAVMLCIALSIMGGIFAWVRKRRLLFAPQI